MGGPHGASANDLKHRLTIKETRERMFSRRDQFAPELLYFSDCVINGEEPEPSGREGLADVRIIRALYHSAASGEPVKLDEFDRDQRPTIKQEIHQSPVKKPPPTPAPRRAEDHQTAKRR